jgi:hypothetical protein
MTRLRGGFVVLALLLCMVGWADAADLSGTWRGSMNGQPAELVLKAGGGGSFNGQGLRWQVLAGSLLLEQGGEVMAYGYSLQGNRMTVSGGDLGAPVQLERGGKAGTAARAAAAPGAQAPRAGGGVRPELAGRWCYLASFSANAGGGSQSSRCFELRADGSYRYQSEGSMSAQAPGMWGGTSSSSSDSGRWTASATSITAHSANGGSTTYPLELRNHPGTRDPMICLDGDCYVTQYQKPSW